MPEMSSKYMTVRPLAQEGARSTMKWAVVNVASGATLGEIKWYGAWRQYCFFPARDTVFSAGCMTDLAAFLEGATEGQHAKWKGAR